MTDPSIYLIDDFSNEQKLGFSSYINSSSGKDMIQITNKLGSNREATFEICDIKSDSTDLVITKCNDYILNEKNEIMVERRLAALTKDGFSKINTYPLIYKLNCNLTELSVDLLEEKRKGNVVESQAIYEVRKLIGGKSSDEIDIAMELENLQVEASGCLKFYKKELVE